MNVEKICSVIKKQSIQTNFFHISNIESDKRKERLQETSETDTGKMLSSKSNKLNCMKGIKWNKAE